MNPYLGYSFGTFSLGLSFSTESDRRSLVETAEDGSEELIRDTEKSTRGTSLYSRFLFGKYFFFEFGAGVYKQKQKIETQIKRNIAESGSFDGEESSNVIEGVGPGYHMGGGLEVPMGGGFFFTSAYQVRILQLRDHEGGSSLGAKRSFEQRRELLFGLAHYMR